MVVGIDLHARILHVVERRSVVHGDTQFAFLAPSHLLQGGELTAELVADGDILVVAKLDEVALSLPQFLHELRDLHLLAFANLYVAGNIKPAGHRRDGEVHVLRHELAPVHTEPCALGPFHHAGVGMVTQHTEQIQAFLDGQGPPVAILLVFIRHEQRHGPLQIGPFSLHVTMGLQRLALIDGGHEVHALARLHARRTFGERTDEQLKDDLVVARLQAEDDAAVGIHRFDIRVLQQVAHHNHVA